jgi:hypothetical protein
VLDSEAIDKVESLSLTRQVDSATVCHLAEVSYDRRTAPPDKARAPRAIGVLILDAVILEE